MTNDDDLIRRGDALSIIEDGGLQERQLAAIAALPAVTPQPVGVKVKPLVWERHHRGLMASAGGIGEAYIFALQHDGRYECIKGMIFAPRFETSDAAKAAAQADYDTRIRSALTIAPAPDAVKVAALVEAACGLLDAYSAIVGTGNPWGDSLRAALRAIEGDKA